MVENELINKIIKEVIKNLEEHGIDKKIKDKIRKKILIVVNGGNKSIDQVFLELNRISTDYDIGVFMSDSSQEIIGKDRFKEYTILEKKESAMDYLERSEIILLPFLTKNTCGKISIGILDTHATYLIGKALLKKKEIIALYDSCIVEGDSIFAKKLNLNIVTLKEFGVKFVTAKELGDYVLDKRNSNISILRNRKVINYKDVKDLKKGNLEISKEAIITPLAREVAKENNVIFVVVS